MADLKIVIPMAGLGKRLAPLTSYKPKALVRLANKRLLDHVLDTFKELEKEYTLDYIFIVGYLGEQIQEHMKDVYPNKKITYYVQKQLMGQSHAVYLAKDTISGPIFLTYCDTINRIDFSSLQFGTMDGIAAVHQIEDPSRHGVAAVDADNLITKLVEKPKTKEHKLALTGLYYFSEGETLIKAIEVQMERNAKLNNEYYLADAINILLERGSRIKSERALQWLDAGTPEAVLETNAFLLQSTPYKGIAASRSNVFIDPVYVDESAHIENSIIGPNVSIGTNCTINDSIISNTIIDDETRVNRVTLTNSLIGKSCSLHGGTIQSIVSDNGELTVDYAANQTSRISPLKPLIKP